MFDRLFERPHALIRIRTGPLVEERRRYLAHCAGQKMAKATLRRMAQHLLAAAEYLKLAARPGEAITLQEIEEAGTRWSSRELPWRTMLQPRLSRQRFIYVAVGWLTFLNRLSIPARPAKAYDEMRVEFADFMQKERGLAPSAIEQRCSSVEEFLGQLCAADRPLLAITVADVDSVLANKVNEQQYARTTVQTCASSLRSFFLLRRNARLVCSRYRGSHHGAASLPTGIASIRSDLGRRAKAAGFHIWRPAPSHPLL
jgi:hypothetical protein